jgi:GT2 family glycosyltransferase
VSAPLVSAIVLSYNRREELRECLTSVLAQDYEALEVVVLDNGSSDGSVEMVRGEFPGVKLVTLSENVGACAGRNRALEQCEGEFVFQMDNDATIEPAEGLRRMVERFESEQDLGIVFTRIEDPESGRPYRPGYGSSYVDDEFYTWRFHGCAAMIRRAAIEKAGYYLPEEFFRAAEENDLAVRVLDAGYNILYMPQTVAFHKLSEKTRDQGEIIYLTVRNNLAVAWKFYPLGRAFLLTLWRVPHFLLTRLAAGDVKALPRVFGVLAAIPGALGRRRPLRRETMAIIDALTLKPALDLEGARRLRENPPKTSLLSLIGRRMRGIRG